MSHVPFALSEDASFSVPFPVTHSVLSATALASEILPFYGLGSQVSCVLLVCGVNDTYLIQTPTEKYILRAYHAGWRTHSDILYEIDVLIHLAQAGVPVSSPVAQTDGEYVYTLVAPEGIRYLVLFTYAPGRPLDRHDATDSYYHGGGLAIIHNATNDFTGSHVRTPLDLSYLLDQSLQVIQARHICSTADWDSLLAIAERLRSRVQQLSRQGLDWGMCHGDGHMLNDHLSDDYTVTFFDFDCCAMGWRAYDLAVVRWCEGFYQKDPGDVLWNAFLKGYTEKRPIADIDHASIPAFVALREIWHTALIAWLQPISGMQGFESILQRTIRLLHEWETAQLK